MPPNYLASFAEGEAGYLDITTPYQVSASPTLSLLDDELGGDLVERAIVWKREYSIRVAVRWFLLTMAYLLAGVVASLVAPKTFVLFDSSNFESWLSLVFVVVFFGLTVRAIVLWRRRQVSFASLASVPLFYAIRNIEAVDLDSTQRWRRSASRALRLLEQAARWTERVPNRPGFGRRSTREALIQAASRKAAYFRELKLYILMPTPLSKNDLLHELRTSILTLATQGWQYLPERDPVVNKTLNRLQRLWFSLLALICLGGLVTFGIWGKYVGNASNVIPYVLAVGLIYAVQRLGVALNAVSQSLDLASRFTRR